MKITNFRGYKRTGSNPLNWRFHARVDVTTRRWFTSTTTTRDIQRQYADLWFFVDDGERCPLAVARLERASNASLAASDLPVLA